MVRNNGVLRTVTCVTLRSSVAANLCSRATGLGMKISISIRNHFWSVVTEASAIA